MFIEVAPARQPMDAADSPPSKSAFRSEMDKSRHKLSELDPARRQEGSTLGEIMTNGMKPVIRKPDLDIDI
jgi:hypothetical protein